MSRLDLHGVKHEDVFRKVIHFVEDSWDSGDEVDIITGHSGAMRDIVIKELQFHIQTEGRALCQFQRA